MRVSGDVVLVDLLVLFSGNVKTLLEVAEGLIVALAACRGHNDLQMGALVRWGPRRDAFIVLI